MGVTPDIRDLDSLLTQLWERHRVFYSVMVVLSALGIFGLACLLGRLP